MRQGPRQCRADRHYPRHPLRMPRCELQRVAAPQRQPDCDGPVGAGRVQHGDGVLDVLAVVVRRVAGWAVRSAVAPPLGRDHPEVPGEVGHLGLPLPHVHDGPRGKQQQCRFPTAEDLVADPHSVPLDGADLIRFSCSHASTHPRQDEPTAALRTRC